MTFLNPFMLFGAAAVGIPLALHFFYRARYRPLPWAAMKFLRLSIEQTSRRLRFQEFILLLLRVLICLLLAFALARPASRDLASGSGRGESVDAILIVDTSYSMNAKENGKSRLDRAKAAAIKVIDNLPPSSTAQVIACSDRATLLPLRSPSNLDQARHLVDNLKASSQSTDFQAGFEMALAAFKSTIGANKEVYLFSDMQRSGWERQATANRSRCEEIKNQASLYLVRCSEKSIKNVAIVGIVAQKDIPHAGTRIPFTVLLKNTGSEAVTDLQLTLEVDGALIGKGAKDSEKDSRAVDRIGPGDTRAVTITGTIDQAGWKLLTARIKTDDLEDDNEYSQMLHIREKIRVLIVDGAPDDREPSKAGTFSLGHALLPIPDEQKGNYHVQLNIIKPQSASAGTLVDRDICILANVPAAQLSNDFTSALDSFVRTGKGLFITSGSNIVPQTYNATFKDLLPIPLIESDPYEAPRDKPLTPDLNSIDVLSFLAKFKEGGRNPLQNLTIADTLMILRVKDPRDEENKKEFGRVLMRFNTGQPMLASKKVGNGEVLLLTTSVDPSWGYLPLNVAFTPFINGCLAHLVQRSNSSYNLVAGDLLRWSPGEATKEYYVMRPDGERQFLGKPKEQDGRILLPSFDTSMAGVYTITAVNEQHGERFAFVPDLRESDNLEALTDDQIDDQLGFKPIHLSTGFDGSAFSGTERSRKEWTIWALTALLIFALGETLWAWFCGRAL